MSPSPAAPAVDRYLGRLRARAILFVATRAVIAGAGAGALVLAVGAWAVGPLARAPAIGVAWALAAAGAAAAAAWAMRPARGLAGGGAARLLAGARSDLVSPVRSAYELGQRAALYGASEELVAAHAKRLRGELARLPPSRVVPTRWLRHPTLGGGTVAAVAGLVLVLGVDRATGGAWALLHPGERDVQGAPIAAAFHDAHARLVFPAYLGRPAVMVADPTRLELPAGTTVELSGRARIDASAAELEVAGSSVAMEREGERWVARFLVRNDGAIGVRIRSTEDGWIRDATARSVHVLPDETPRVAMIAPSEDAVVEGAETLPIAFEAHDDVGVVSVDLVVRGADAREHRRRLATPDRAVSTDVIGDDALALLELGAAPGDRVELWLEATDGDDVGGPHVGRSETRTLTVASAATRREESLDALDALVDQAIDTLADRLESVPPEDEGPARVRLDAMRASTDRLVFALDAFAARARRQGARHADAVLYAEASSRIRRLGFEELRLHGTPIAALPARQRVDERAVAELEEDVLLLHDLLMRARIEDAAAIARELESLRREIASLLRELRRADTPEARAALLAAIARAQQRLDDLRTRMSRLGTSVPQEFANAQEAEAQRTEEALASLREAVESGDLDAAQRALTRLEQEIDALARSLGASEESFAEQRFGPRDRALADALDRLMGLEAEQRELARRTSDVRGAAARRALEESGARAEEAARRLAGRARQVQGALAPIQREQLSTLERDSLDAIQQRLRDTEDALGAGDLGEASRMVESAEEQLGDLSRDLALDSMMFSGHDGQTARASRAAADAERRLRELRESLEEALPDLGDHVGQGERGQMQGDAPRQRTAQGATSDLAELFERGPDGTPLSPEAAGTLGEIAGLMEQGAQRLDRVDPAGASRAQEEAARQLTELREQIEQDMQRSSGGGGGGEDGTAAPDFSRRVHIRDPDDFEGPMELRRRLLDAMHEAPPPGYEESVQRYYEGLLR